MKVANEWAKECPGNTFSPSFEAWIASIQLDAWRQGMTDAAKIAYGRISEKAKAINEASESNGLTLLHF